MWAHCRLWLDDTYDIQEVHPREVHDRTACNRDTIAAIVDETALDDDGRTVRRIEQLRANCRTILLADSDDQRCRADDCLDTPITRGPLLSAVERARRIAAYDESIKELLALTTRHRRLREDPDAERPETRRERVRVAMRIEQLHERIDGSLSDVESRYPEFVGDSR
ncbi:hypothetical protein DVK02_13030 [Halobellus sp. Atlit-31R]|nr:hypothetical protein DVK02_13030 [Halobellus sp. Atlit-31R]